MDQTNAGLSYLTYVSKTPGEKELRPDGHTIKPHSEVIP